MNHQSSISLINGSSERYRLRPFVSIVIVILPVVLMAIFWAGMNTDNVRSTFMWMLQENHPVELLTFIFLLAGGLLGLRLAYQLNMRRERAWVYGFYVFFSLILLLVAMEEVAWGQWFFGFKTPTFFKEINAQGELTLHNIQVLQGHSEYFRLSFGLGGLIGYALGRLKPFYKIAPSILLLPWFIVIVGHAGLDLYNDYFPIQREFDYMMQRSSELVEMLIGMVGLLYIWLNSRMLQGH